MSQGKSNPTTSPEDLSITLTRVFDAPRPLVFEAWTKKEHLDQWCAPRGFTIPSSDADFRPGGEWHCLMIAPDGEKFPVRGVYREIVANELLVMTHIWEEDDGTTEHETVLTVRFTDEDGKTKVTLEQSIFKSVESREGHRGGWTQCFDNLSEHLAKLQPKETDGMPDREIVLSRVFDAPRELVWEAMTDPKKVVNWWGPRGFTMTIEEMDLRPGGVWKHVLHGPDGTDYPNHSVFSEITKPERIVFSVDGGKKGGHAVSFEMTWIFDVVQGNKTKLTLRQVYASNEERDMVGKVYGAIEGGKQCLARLGEQLAATPIVIERTFDAPIGMLWKAITDPTQMKQWYFDNLEAFKPEVGFETRVVVQHNDEEYPHLWKVTEAVPEKKLAYTWKYEGDPGESLVTFELFPEGKKTRVKLTHSGLDSFQPESKPKYARSNFTKGWTMLIGTELKEFLEKQR